MGVGVLRPVHRSRAHEGCGSFAEHGIKFPPLGASNFAATVGLAVSVVMERSCEPARDVDIVILEPQPAESRRVGGDDQPRRTLEQLRRLEAGQS
jgi:hypothetical protein